MSKAYLTIDDVTSNRTKIIVDGLIERGIWPLMFATGKYLEEHWDEGIYALKRGIILVPATTQPSSTTISVCIVATIASSITLILSSAL